MEDVLFVLPAELHTFMLVHIGYRRSIRHHFGTIAFKNRIQYANDWAQIQKSNTICERLGTKNIRPHSDAEGCNPCKSKKNPLKHLISAGWRRWRDSNSRGLLHPYCISSADPSTAWVHLRMKNIQFQCMDNMISRAMEGRFLTLIFSNRLISSLHQSL